jgi:hypothetical protein
VLRNLLLRNVGAKSAFLRLRNLGAKPVANKNKRTHTHTNKQSKLTEQKIMAKQQKQKTTNKETN